MFVKIGIRDGTVTSLFVVDTPMQPRRDVVLTQPALIPIAGNFDRKPRLLDRDVTTIGRARGSDLCLEANEISTLHCIVYRTPDGFRIRDCNSRCGVRINGQSVKNGRLHDSDILNLGPFSFEVHLPTELFPADRVDPAKIEHWKQSRRKLALLALKMRKKANLGAAAVVEQEWAHKAHVLKEKIRVYDQRLRELEEAEEDLANDRKELEREKEAHQQRVQAVEGEIANRLGHADAEIKKRWQEFQQRCKTEEDKVPPRGKVEAGEPDRDLDQLRHNLRMIEEQLSRQQEAMQREQQEFTTMKDQWVKAQSKSSAALEDQHTALAAQEAAVQAQKAELARMMGELKTLQENLRKQARPDVRQLQEGVERLEHENAELRGALEAARQAPAAAPDGGNNEQVESLRCEVQLLYQELESKETVLKQLQESSNGDSAGASAKLQAENELLRKLLDEKSAEAPAKADDGAPKNESDLERYETELNEYRRQLDEDRNKLNKEVETLRERNKELDEAVREMEMEMSKERAELARERMRLERVREEVKTDMEKLHREAAVRESLGPVQKLRDELTGKQPAAKPEKQLNDRLRSMRTQLSDSHPTASS
jgi:chromosome segregation ATPase